MTKLDVFRRDPSTLTSSTPPKENETANYGDADGASNEFGHIDPNKVRTKLDIRLIPVLTVLYLLSFLDRGNIGNARIEGLAETLKMTGPQYNWTLTAFFFTYALFQVPSNLLLKRFTPSIWLPSIMVAWGTVMTLMGLVQNFRGLLTARIFLGVAEAGLFPGVSYYITLWYVREECQFRQALFSSAAGIAGAFSGLLAFAIAKMDGIGGLEGWRWIFILEGILTVVTACISFFLIYDSPENATFLSRDERAWLVHHLKYQGSKESGHLIAESDEFQWKYVKDAFSDWQIYVHVLLYWGVDCPLYGIALFLPTIVKELGYTSSTAQLLTVPIYVTACAVSVTVSFYSDRRRQRSPFILAAMCTVLVGFIMCIAASSRGAHGAVYAGIFILTCGTYPAGAGMVTWLSNNLAGSYKRSAGMAIQISIGNLSGAMASNFYRESDSPKYILGHALEIAFVSVGLLAIVTLRLNYQRINHKRDAEPAREYSEEEMSVLGDRAPTFRYII